MKVAPGLALRNRPKVIQKWEITLILDFFFHVLQHGAFNLRELWNV